MSSSPPASETPGASLTERGRLRPRRLLSRDGAARRPRGGRAARRALALGFAALSFVPLAHAAPGQTSLALIDAAERTGSVGAPEAALRRAQAVLAPGRLPLALRGVRAPLGEGLTLALRTAFLGRETLLPELRSELDRLLQRPTDARDDYAFTVAPEAPYCTAHFCLHWVTTTVDAPPLLDLDQTGTPDFVEVSAAAFERSYDALIAIGYSLHGVDDGTLGGDARIDVYVKEAGQDFAAAVFPEDIQEYVPFRLSSYVMLNTSISAWGYPEAYVAEVISHELKHVFDAATFGNAPSWLFESSAVWVENQVDDTARFYSAWYPCWYLYPDVSLDIGRFDQAYAPGDPRDTRGCSQQQTHIYGSSAWWFHTTALHGIEVQRRVWDDGGRACTTVQTDPDVAANRACVAGVIDAILAEQGTDFRRTFVDFSVENLAPRLSATLGLVESPEELLEWPREAHLSVRASFYPAQGALTLSHLATHYLEFRAPVGTRGTLTATLTLPAQGGLVPTALAVTRAGEITRTLLEPVNETATFELEGLGAAYERVVLVVTNPEPIRVDGASDFREFEYAAAFVREPPAGTGGSAGAGGASSGGVGGAGAAPDAAPTVEGGGCGCGVPASTRTVAWPFVGALFALLGRRRRQPW